MKKEKVLKIGLAVFASLLFLLIVFAGIKIYKGVEFNKKIEETENERKLKPYEIIEYKGETYSYKDNIYNILVVGVDIGGEQVESEMSQVGGQADSIFVLSIDNTEKTISAVQVNRDAMTDIRKLGVFGGVVGKTHAQIALSYAYGDGGEGSANNTVLAVSDYFGGIPIDGYLCLNMNGMVELVDALGGVELTLDYDLTKFDPALKKGETLNLTGEQAYIYLRSRKDVGNQTNAERMERHRNFYQALFKSVDRVLSSDISRMMVIYDAIYDYSNFSLSVSKLMSLYSASAEYTRLDTVTPEGETKYNEFAEFYTDEQSLKEITLKTWYKKN